MKRRLTFRRTIVSICCLVGLGIASLGAQCTGGDAPGGFDPTVPTGNRPPSLIITGVTTPGEAYFAEQGDPVTISFTGSDGEDVAVIRVFASTSNNPTPAEEILISDGFSVGPGTGSGSSVWDTSSIELGSYQIFAEIDDRTYDSNTGLGNPAVRVAAPQPLLIAPVGTAPENGAPTLVVELPLADAGVTNKDVLTIRFDIKDPDSDEDDIALTYYLDKDRNAANDDVDPPLEVGSTTLSAGFAPADTLFQLQEDITIDLNEMPIRLQTDEGGRPLPYYVRVKADDGNGGVVNAYATGAVRIVSAASDVVDLLTVGSTVAGATFQGFNGHPDTELRGSRAGSCFTSLGDFDNDGLADFVIGAQTASPYNENRVGQASIIYGRQRTPDPDLLATGFAQGRLSGVIGLNTVGTFKSFPVSDPRYRTIFNVRGNQLPCTSGGEGYGGFRTLGLNALGMMPNITRGADDVEPVDDTPELLLGLGFVSNWADEEDMDPCDECTWTDAERFPPVLCYGDAVANYGDSALEANIDLPLDGVMMPDVWTPGVPPLENPIVFNVDLGLAEERILSIKAVTITLSGNRMDLQDVSFHLDIQLEAGDGPLGTGLTIPIFPDPSGGEPDGQFEEAMIIISPSSDPEFPVSMEETFPPSMYDGLFNIYFKADTFVEISDITVTVDCITVTPEEHDLRFVYRDGFPSPYSNDDSNCDDDDPALFDPFALSEVSPACLPMNRDFLPYLRPGDWWPDGQLCAGLPFSVYGVPDSEGSNDSIMPNTEEYQSGFVVCAAGDNMVLRRDELTGRYLGDTQDTGDTHRLVDIVADVGRFGQVPYVWEGSGGLRGARFRGAWFNAIDGNTGLSTNYALYDPSSLFGYTVDSMPELSPEGDASIGAEMIVSAPAQAINTAYIPDLNPDENLPEWWIRLTDLEGTYDDSGAEPTQHSFDYNVTFSSVKYAYIAVRGTASNNARLRLFWGTDDFGEDIAPVDVFLSVGALDPQNLGFYDVYTPSFEFYTALPLTREAMLTLREGHGTLYARLLDDCVTKESAVDVFEAYLVVDRAMVTGCGGMYVYAGFDWTRNLELSFGCTLITNGDTESDDSRPMSWPSAHCWEVGVGEGEGESDWLQRSYCYPALISSYYGEAIEDAFGWGHSVGDVGGSSAGPDGNPDIVCGAPLSDNDPWNPDTTNCPPQEDTPLTNNGKVYLIYGSQTPARQAYPCAVERFEIRGTHDDDQFGRCQGAAGDMNGDGFADFFFAAEGYDADGTDGVPSTGADAGFVGVLFASTAITGERTIRAEQVGTANFLGCKFVGGSAGALIGGSSGSSEVLANLVAPYEEAGIVHPLIRAHADEILSRGQYGVSSAGDFNIDGFDDLLITAPGQEWPGARILFNGSVADGSTVRINSITFEFDTNGVVSSGRVPVSLSDVSAEAAQKALMAAMSTYSAETIGISSVRSQSDFPAPLEDIPTITFIARRADTLTVTSSGANISANTFVRQGVAYLVFGSDALLQNNTFVLPDDLNRRVNGKRILKGVVFVSAYEKDTGPSDESPDEAPVEVVSSVGDVDGDGFVDIILGAPQADFINILAPDQRRQASGDAYLIYGNGFGLNSASQN